MPKYVVLINATDQGVRTIRDSPAVRQKGRERAKALGITREIFFTMGPYDAVAIVDAPNDEAVTSVLLNLGSQGDIRTLTMKAYTEDEWDRIIEGLPPAQG